MWPVELKLFATSVPTAELLVFASYSKSFVCFCCLGRFGCLLACLNRFFRTFWWLSIINGALVACEDDGYF